jgi:putative ABC transport system substrate-binding protein
MAPSPVSPRSRSADGLRKGPLIERRTFMALVSGGLLAAPLAAEAQSVAKVPRIAVLTTTSPPGSPAIEAFIRGLRDLGYVEGQNIAIEWRWGRGATERFPDFAADVVRLKVDIILAANSAAGHAAQTATKTIPIVIPNMADPVGDGFAISLSQPGGNITGLSVQLSELQGKRLQLLKEVVPNLSRLALLADTTQKTYHQAVRETEEAARTLGLHLRLYKVSSPSALNGAFVSMSKEATSAVSIVEGTMLYANRAQLAEQALKNRLPIMCDVREQAAAGCLVSYGPSLEDLFRRAAVYVDKILKGAKPADLPVQQPTKFELVINLKTAKALGLTIPQSLLLRADELIQ